MDKEMGLVFGGIYNTKKVLLTGHTGFKGSWLAFWLQRLGAEVCGVSLSAPTDPSHWNLLQLDMRTEYSDIRDYDSLETIFREFRPAVVFHLAAQALVRASYCDPIGTYSTNVMGTLNVFEACRKTDSVRAVINVTSDKCYENREWHRGYREDDAMGGYDPYSASKGCSELLTSSYRNSFFNNEKFGITHQTLLASCRAGNVVGGGDWAQDRLIPDIMRSVSEDKPVLIRNPYATRPWQHVLEPLGGYLRVGQRLLEGRTEMATSWNFGPDENDALTVCEVVESIKKHWSRIDHRFSQDADGPHEAHLLTLDCTKSRQQLGWFPVWDSEATFEKTVSWYRNFYEDQRLTTEANLSDYIQQSTTEDIDEGSNCITK